MGFELRFTALFYAEMLHSGASEFYRKLQSNFRVYTRVKESNNLSSETLFILIYDATCDVTCVCSYLTNLLLTQKIFD